LVESYRNADNRVCHCTILNIGFMEDATPKQLNIIQKRLTEKYERKEPLFEHEEDSVVKKYVQQLWQRIIDSKKFDITSVEKLARMINADTMQHSNVREIAAKWMCYNTWNKLQLTTRKSVVHKLELKKNEIQQQREFEPGWLQNWVRYCI
jgi:hypothetical protein